MSICERYGSTIENGRSALTTSPHFLPFDLIASIAPCTFFDASGWNVTISAPASQKAPTYFSGKVIIRCASIVRFEFALSAFTIGIPKVMFGTYTPSITSQCTISAPHFSMAFTSLSILPKSADNIDGATNISFLLFLFYKRL